ncbi:MAG: methylated-DNA--[protein]-cysteine S-methyltransferase [Phycisphaerales bacterium]
MPVRTIDSPLGPMLATSNDGSLTALGFDGEPDHDDACDVLDRVETQLARYFAGELDRFELPLAPQGTPFQQRVWDALLRIPPGETRSYASVARQIDNPDAIRAVGAANGANPIAIIIPCHRVIASDGTLHGYAGGLKRKRYLLDLEAQTLFA